MNRSKAVLAGTGVLVAILTGGLTVMLLGSDGPALPVITETPEAAAARAERCAVIRASVADAGFAAEVDIACDDRQAHLASDSYPDHELMTGIVGTNEQVPVPAAGYTAPTPLEPRLTGSPKTRDASLAVAVNGVPIFDYTGGGEMSIEDLHHHLTEHDTILTHQLDVCGGHAGRGDDYHYHAKPTCMIEAMENAGDAAILGWAFDGFPIYGDNNPDGTPVGREALDVCNGQPDEVFGYRYHTSKDAPYIIQCLMGEVVDLRHLPRIAPLRPAEGSDDRTVGRPPQGGVENLTFVQDPSGERRMDYVYEGEAYYIRYRPAETPGCYHFETRTVTDDGVVKSGDYCR